MRNILTIVRYEYKMQMRRCAVWGVFAAALVFSLLDDFPSGVNCRRLEFLTDPVYFVYRTMSLGGLPLVFGLMILLSDRFSLDRKSGVRYLIMAGPITKAQYILGKSLGGVCSSAAVFSLYLAANSAVYYLAAPFPVQMGSLLGAVARTILICVLPVSAFIGLAAVNLPALMDARLFYAIAAVYYIVNASITGSAGAMPFWCVTSGDLIKLIWQHLGWTYINAGSIQANLAFLLGSGGLSLLLIYTKRRFWRAG